MREGPKKIAAALKAIHDGLSEAMAKHAEGQLNPSCVASRLLSIIDPTTGKPLPDDLLLPEAAIIFAAGDDYDVAWFS